MVLRHRATSLLLTAACLAVSACSDGGTDARAPAPAHATVAPAPARTATGAPAPVFAVAPIATLSFEQQEPWLSTNASFNAGAYLDQPTIQTPGATPTSPPTLAFAGAPDFTKLVIDLCCFSHSRKPSEPAPTEPGPLSHLHELRIYGDDHDHPIATFSKSQLGYNTSSEPGFEYDGRGPIVYLVERLRVPFAAHATLIQDHPFHLTVLALDDQGRTMTAQSLEGDLSAQPITPPPR